MTCAGHWGSSLLIVLTIVLVIKEGLRFVCNAAVSANKLRLVIGRDEPKVCSDSRVSSSGSHSRGG